MRRALALLLLAVALIGAKKAADPYDPGTLFDDKSVLHELTEAEKALDAELGRIPKRPRILLSSREFAFERALADQREILQKLLPDADETFIRQQAAQVAVGAFAFYEPEKNTVHILPDNFIAVARLEKDREYLTPEFLRMVLVHELVHGWDCQERGLETLRKSLESPNQGKVLSAVGEGHAQFITERVMKRMKREDDFKKFNDAVFNTAEKEEDPGDRYLREKASANARFGYVEGLAFFRGLEKEGKPELLDLPFKKLPESVSVILHPERLAHPPDRPPRST